MPVSEETAELGPWEYSGDNRRGFGAHVRSCFTLSVAPSKAFQALLRSFVTVSILSLNLVPLHPFALSREASSDSLHSLRGDFNE